MKLVRPDGSSYKYTPSHEPIVPQQRAGFRMRVAFAAAHVVVDPLRTTDPLTQPVVDW